MTKLYEEIKGECGQRGLRAQGEDGTSTEACRCIYARVYACKEHTCVQVAAFRGMRPPDMLLERGNLMGQYEVDMKQEGVDLSDYADVEGM
jgi:hypothetical protein